MRPGHAVPLAVLAALGLAVPAVAGAAPWNRVTAPDGSSIDQVSLVQTSNGTMVAWQHPSGPSTTDLLVSKVDAGKLVSTSTVVSGWAGIQNPAIVTLGGVLRVFWGGQQTTNTDDPLQELNTASSADGGATWALQPTSVVEAGNQAYGSPVTAAAGEVGGLGVTLEAWAATLGLFTHRDLTTGVATVSHPVGNYAYNPGLAFGRDGFGFAWYSNAAGSLGVFAQIIDPDGADVTPVTQLPGTGDMTTGMLARTPIVGTDDQGAGFYVAYPTGNPTQNKIRVFGGIGTKGGVKSTLVGRADGNSYATLAYAPNGRLWVAWTSKDEDGNPVVIARRSNPERTEWGEPVVAGAPKGADSAYAVDASADEGSDLNLFANVSIGTAPTTATWVTRVEAGLTLTRVSGSLEKGDENTVTFKVTDAGDAVKGVKVKCGGDSGTTNKKGVVKLDVTGRGAQMTATAKDSDYTTDTLTLRVRK